MANSLEDEYGESDEEPGTEGPKLPYKAALTIRDFFAPQNALFARHGAARGTTKMLKDINAGAVLPDNQHRRRVQPDHLVAGPASGRILTKARLHRAQFDPVWWEKHQAQVEAEAAALEARAQLLSRHGERPRAASVEPLTWREEQAQADRDARVQVLREAADQVQEQFEDEFSWEQRKLIAAQAYYTERLALAVCTGTVSCTIRQATNCAARAAFVHFDTASSWMHDHLNNGGWFSRSLWGTHTKTPSFRVGRD